MMNEHLRPMSRKQLREVITSYVPFFPAWKISDETLDRQSGPVVQQIGFEALRYKAYRLSCTLWIKGCPKLSMLHQFLDIKHRDIEYSCHEDMMPRVVVAMREQFYPQIEQSLNLEQVMSLCEAEMRDNSPNDLLFVAVLAAYLGRLNTGLRCCDDAEDVIQSGENPTVHAHNIWLGYAKGLREALTRGKEREYALTGKVE